MIIRWLYKDMQPHGFQQKKSKGSFQLIVNMKTPCIIILLLIFLSVLISSSPTIAEEAEAPYDYLRTSIRGPGQLGNLREERDFCKQGTQQSPIDLLTRRAKIVSTSGTRNLQLNYRPSNAKIVNRGRDVMVEWLGDAGSIRINGADYKLIQCHWHSPSEHTIDGKRFALEKHLVHQRTDAILGNQTAVIGILYNIGQPHGFLSKLERPIETVTEGERQMNIGIINPRDIKVDNENYYRYMGSLTTPPCTEGVIWTVSERVKTVSYKQLGLLRAAVQNQDNARPLQPLNGRKIILYKSKNQEEFLDMADS